MRKLLTQLTAIATLTPALLACSGYKVQVQQGNVITQEAVSQLEKGMSREQVRFVLGNPLVQDPFHHDRWDYYYSLREGGELVEKRRLTLYFDGDKLERVEGDVKAADQTPPDSQGSSPGNSDDG